ncbi:MBL fold metallo-hydrolase [Rhodobacter sp. Har01]|nr:MBL fold metallo-hydrolase [Rhodobacter sp. Har01]MCB6177517.1 MBL fold metallo-hydrolase [Rhodobacter sp. Har01]
MTGPGTTTYVLGKGSVAVIDPGPDDPRHLRAILAALAPGESVAAILVTHPHLDHSALAPQLRQATGAQVLGFGPPGSGHSPLMRRLAKAGLTGGGEGVDPGFAPDRCLSEGETVDGPGWSLRVLHTPGHMAEHLCFAWGRMLFTGDLVMGWAPSLVSPPDGDMGAYLASLSRIAQQDWQMLLPTHGPPVTDPARRIAELTAHRKGREAQVLKALDRGATTLPEIVAVVYHDLSPALQPAAARNALAHLIDLAERNLVVAEPAPLPAARFRPRRPAP